jgi:hypothetical protein
MKRHPKPFSVEIKKSRTANQRDTLPPRRLFDAVPTDAAKIFEPHEPQMVGEPAAPRILPSIVAPVWSNSEATEPVRRKRASGPKAIQTQIEFDLPVIASDDMQDTSAEPSTILQSVLMPDAVIIEETATFANVAQAHETGSPKVRFWKKAARKVAPAMTSERVSQPEHASEAEKIEPLLLERSRRTDHRRPTRHRAAATQLPRHERWKRRLHPAAW